MGERRWVGSVRGSKTSSGLVPLAPCLLPLACCLLLVGCGYQFRVEGAGPTIGGAAATSSPASPPPRLIVRTLENKSFEPNLETRYTNYLRHEFSSGSGAQIVTDTEAADLVLSGQILSVSVPTLSFSQTTTLDRRTEVVVMVKVEETRTKRLVWAQTSKGASEFESGQLAKPTARPASDNADTHIK
ncbi:MAG: LPS assembly lipoprotein LptE [Nitrospirae bacterium]|nr:LPS assembly lipoprotein LptE [Nitrospirota bacterium]